VGNIGVISTVSLAKSSSSLSISLDHVDGVQSMCAFYQLGKTQMCGNRFKYFTFPFSINMTPFLHPIFTFDHLTF